MQNTNNMGELCGIVCDELQYSHSVHGEQFYIGFIEVERLSGYKDRIRFLISERLLPVDSPECMKEHWFHMFGQLRTYNEQDKETGKSHLRVYFFVLSIKPIDEFREENKAILNKNYLKLNAFVCKPPIYRKTALGREIADMIVAANRPYGKSDYIPCIFWGRNARYAGTSVYVGDNIIIEGRMQSREYRTLSEPDVTKTAYEVSVFTFNK